MPAGAADSAEHSDNCYRSRASASGALDGVQEPAILAWTGSFPLLRSVSPLIGDK